MTLIDGTDPNLSVPGLCAVLHALPTVVAPLGNASAGGSVPTGLLDLPYVGGAIGANLYLQSVALDAGQTGLAVALSQGRRLTVPTLPASPGVARAFSYTGWNGRTYGAVGTGGVVAKLDYN